MLSVICVLCFAASALAAPMSSSCGVPAITPSNRVVGGEDAIPGSWPWQVSIKDVDFHFCGGSLINDQWVVTAAHCMSRSTGSWNIVLGSHRRDATDSTEQSFKVAYSVSHEDYKSRTMENDIALIKLDGKVEYTDQVSPVCLAQTSYAPGVGCYATGWGDDEVVFPVELDLQQVDVPILSTDTCNQQLWYNGEVDDFSMVCAGYANGGKDTCQGDSGGPLVCPNTSGGFDLMGVTSWGYGCADARNPGIYARVPSYISWINDQIAAN